MPKRTQHARRLFAIVAVAVALSVASPTPPAFAGQSGDSSTPLIEHIVNPQATDPAIDQALDDHYAWLDTTAPTNRQLFVIYAGHILRPRDCPANPAEGGSATTPSA